MENLSARRSLPVLAASILALCVSSPSHAATFAIDISPAGGTALNFGSTTYAGDHAIGLSALNAVGQPASPATGNEVGAGILYDDVTNTLTFDFAYGSAFGFTDLAGPYTTTHLHGAVPVQFPAPNTGAGVVVDLDGFHIPSGALSGRFAGSVVLTVAQEIDLFDNEIYVNIHSGFAGGGEIRGQLVPVGIPEPSAAMLMLVALGATLRRRR